MAREAYSAGTVYVQVLPTLDGWGEDLSGKLQRELAGVKAKVALEPMVDVADFQRQLDEKLRNLRASATVQLNVDTASALADIAAVDSALDDLDGRSVDIDVDADVGAALAELAEVEAVADDLDGRDVTVDINADDHGSINHSISRLQALILAVTAASGAIGGLGAAFLALGAGAVVGGAGVLATAVGLKDIASAMKAQSQASKQAGQTAAQEAAQRLSSANQVLNAQDALKSARQGVADAERTASTTIRTALIAQTRAEEQLQAAQVSALRTQQALTDARNEAERSLEDLTNKAIDDALAQRQAVLDLQTAQAHLATTLADPAATEQQREQAQLTFDQARQHLTEISLSYQRSQVDAKAAAEAGVDGNRQVVAATDAVTNSQRQLRDAQVSAEESARRVDEARVTGAQQVARAQEQVIHAQRALAQAQAAQATQATRQGEASTKYQEALEKLTPASVQFIAYLRGQSSEWGELRKASQGFVPGLQQAFEGLQPLYGQLNTNVATISASTGAFFEVIGDGLARSGPFWDQIASASTTLMPRFGETVNRAAGAVGELVLEMLPLSGLALSTVDSFSEMIRTLSPFIAQASGPLLESLRSVINDVATLGPLLVDLATFAGGLTTALVDGLTSGLRQMQPGLHDFLAATIDLVQALSPLLASTGQLVGFLAQAAAPVLRLVADVLTPVVKLISTLVDLVTQLPAPLVSVALGMGAVALATGPVAKFFEGLGKTTANLALNAGVLTESLTRNATAGTAVASAGSKMAGVLSGVGKALPVVGLALVGVGVLLEQHAEQQRKDTEMAEKLGAALLRGGQAANEAARQIKLFRQTAAAMPGAAGESFKQVADAAEESARRQRESMTDVEFAQGRVRQAQLDYNKAVRDYGENSSPALDFANQYRARLGELEEAQRRAASATKSHTQQLQDQQDLLLGLADAQAGFERAGIRVKKANLDYHDALDKSGQAADDAKKAQTDYNAAVAKNGANSQAAKNALTKLVAAQKAADQAASDAKESQLDLNSAQTAYVSASAAAAVAEAKTKTGADQSAAAVKGHNDALLDLLHTQGQELPPAILSMLAQIGLGKDAWGGLTATVDKTGQTILSLPGGPNQPPVEIKFHDNADVVANNIAGLKQDISDLTVWLDTLLKSPGIGTTSLAKLLGLEPSAITALVGTPGAPAPSSAFPGTIGRGLGRASGGPIPGTGSGDTVPALLTPGEFVFSQPAVSRLGMGNLAALHSAARYADGGPVTPLRLATGGGVGGGLGGASGIPALAWLAQLAGLFGDVTDTAAPLAAALDRRVSPALQTVLTSTGELASATHADWSAITGDVGAASSTIVGSHFAVLRAGLSGVDSAVSSTSSTFGSRFAAIRGYTADPVRYALQFPFTSLVAAWNLIDSTFAVGKPLSPIPIPFAAGGAVFGGTPGRDSVPAYLMPGEYVLPVAMVRQIGVGNLEHARRSVLSGGSAEGLIPGFEAGGAVTKALAFAVSQVGKPYLWGAVGPDGYDCSGLVSAVSNVALGLSPYARRFTTADFAPGRGAGGYLPGRESALVIGVSDSHMAGTIAGHNFESTTKNGISGVRVGGDASGALDAQFSKGQFYLPQVGGTFIPGPTGGAVFDLAGLLDTTFASTRDAIASIGSAFGANTLAAGASAELAAMLSATIAWAKANLAVAGAVPGSGPVVDQVRGVAARYGWGEGAQWDALSTLIAHESSWDPAAQNPFSTAFGLFQFLQSTRDAYGLGLTTNPALQAEAGLRYIQDRYGDPVNAWNFWRGNHWYDNGGYLPPGLSLAYNGTSRPEPVLTSEQWRAMGANQKAGGSFTGTLRLDSGEFLGVVRGEIDHVNDATGRALATRTRI